MSRARQLFSVPVANTTNKDGYAAYDRSLEEKYLQCLLTNTMSNTFYAGKQELLKDANELHEKMLQKDPGFMAKSLAFARNEGFMRLQPIFGLVHLSQHQEFAKAFREVIKIPSDLAEFMTIMNSQGRGEGGRAIKRRISDFLNDISEYWAMKYSGRGRGYNLADAISTSHPKAKNERQQQLFRYLLGKDADLAELPQIGAYEAFKRAETDEERIHWIEQGKLHYELVTSAGKPSKAIWNAIVKQLPIFALVRHLNALERAGVLEENKGYIIERLTNSEALAKSKILPFQFLKTFYEVSVPWARDVLRQAVELTFGNLPNIKGSTAVFLDISGSMNGDYLKIGSVFALALYKKTKGDGVFWLFDTSVYDPKASLYDSILSQAERIRTQGGTNTAAPVQALNHKGIKVDNIIMITDEQQNSGSSFYSALNAYRKNINKDAKCFVVDLAPYHGYMVPPTDKLTHYIFGWSDQVLDYIGLASQGFGGLVDHVKRLQLGE